MLPVRSGKRALSRQVFNEALLAIARRENKSKVVGLIIGTNGDTRVTMTLHADGSFTVVDEQIGKPDCSTLTDKIEFWVDG